MSTKIPYKQFAAKLRALKLIQVMRDRWAGRLSEAQTRVYKWAPAHTGYETYIDWCNKQSEAFRQCARWANEQRRVEAFRIE